MRITLSILAVLALILAAPSHTKAQTPPGGVGTTDDLPAQDTIMWDLKLLEEAADVTLVKRTVDKDQKQVTWLFDLNSDDAAKRFFYFSGASVYPQVFIRFFDEDSVSLGDVPLTNGGGTYEKGQRVRVNLKVPDREIMVKARTAKVVFKKD